MAKRKIKLTRPELKRQRDQLARFERYLPMLKLKQQQLQLTMRGILKERRAAIREVQKARAAFEPYRAVLADTAGVNVEALAEPEEVRTSKRNVAGVWLPVYEEAVFPQLAYSLFATPPWVDRALGDLREIARTEARQTILERQYQMLQEELTKIIQRVNLFEKVKIPDAREAIRRIRIRLGDEMTAGVARAKIAKNKLAEFDEHSVTEHVALHE
jgi:V/A-type H+-transporting ATPase subunit D